MAKKNALNGFEIEDGVPIPRCSTKAGTPLGNTIRALNVGQSFEVPLGKEAPKERSRISNTVAAIGLRQKRKFVTRKTEDGSAIRIWRTE